MKKVFVITFLFLLLIVTISFQFVQIEDAPKEAQKYKIIGYVPSWFDWTQIPVEVEKMTHINYAFGTLYKNGAVKQPNSTDIQNLQYLNSLKSRNKDLKILISIGGWGADFFSNAALTKASRVRFARTAIDYLKVSKLDGIDIDWEYPGQSGGGNIFRPEDKGNFTLLLKELRLHLDIESAKLGREAGDKLLLTIATGGDKEYLKHVELGEVHKYVDFINVMTYDLYNGFDKVTGHHSNLYHSSYGDQTRNCGADAIEGHIKAGVAPSKLVLGVPFYGRGWEKVNSVNNGLYQASEGKHIYMSYDSLKAAYINKNGYERIWDTDAKSPYLWNKEIRTFITYMDEEALHYKVDYVKNNNLGGVMFWEYSNDLKERGLLHKIYQELNGLTQ
jgi:chitinase